jgi:hypothetical protein
MVISRTDHLKNVEVLHRVKWKKYVLQYTEGRINGLGHDLRRNCLLERVIQGKM